VIEAKDLRGNDPDELRRTVRKLEEDLFKHTLKKNTSQLENTMLIRSTRRDIARVNTVLAEKLRGGTAQASAGAAAKTEAVEAAPAVDKAAKPAKTTAKAAKTAAKKTTAKANAPAKPKTSAKET
jgi:large subunit ribosomal protein L29